MNPNYFKIFILNFEKKKKNVNLLNHITNKFNIYDLIKKENFIIIYMLYERLDLVKVLSRAVDHILLIICMYV